MSHVNHGRFVWHELSTHQPSADLAFLEALVGLSAVERDMGALGPYTMLMAGDTGVGGVTAAGVGASPTSHWIGNLCVSDIDSAVTNAEAAGGRLLTPVVPVEEVGRTALLADPDGAVFALLEPATEEDMLADAPWVPGRFCWWELITPHPDAARDFYGRLAGWGCHEIDMGGRPYWLWTQGDEGMNPGGLMRDPEGGSVAHWLFYMLVDDVNSATERVAGLGGTVLSAPMDVPGQGRMSVIATPSGAAMALFKSAQS